MYIEDNVVLDGAVRSWFEEKIQVPASPDWPACEEERSNEVVVQIAMTALRILDASRNRKSTRKMRYNKRRREILAKQVSRIYE